MARNHEIKVLRTTRAALDAQASGMQLNQGEPYFITDEDGLAIGTASSTYSNIGKADNVGTGEEVFKGATGTHNTLEFRTIKPITGTNALIGATVGDEIQLAVFSWRSIDIDTGTGRLGLVNDVDSPGNNQVYGTNGSGTKGWKPDPSGGISNVVEDTTPALGGTLDANNFNFDMGNNHLISESIIAQHEFDTNTDIRFSGSDQFEVRTGGLARFRVTNVTTSIFNNVSIPSGNLDVTGYIRGRANVIDLGTGGGTTVISTGLSGNVYYARPSISTRSLRLDSSTIGTQVEVHRNGNGIVQFTQGASQTIIQGSTVQIKDKGAAVAICVATNTWSVVGSV